MDIYKGNKSDEWATPRSLLDKLNSQYNFSVDLAASKENTAVGGNYFSLENSALISPWNFTGVAWLNPPFSLAKEFLEKAAASQCQIVSIYKSTNTETALWQDVIFKKADWVFFPRGRVQYESPEADNNAPFASALIGWRVPPPMGIDGKLFPLSPEMVAFTLAR